jgi:hypothetical protein
MLTHSPRIVTDGLVLCLDAASRKSYPGSGTVWTDLAGSNNGALTNDPTFNSANGGSIAFDGTNDYINLGSIINGPLNGISFCFYCYYKGYTNFPRIIAKNHDSPWTIFFDPDNTIAFFVMNSQMRNLISIEPNKWFFACFTYDNSTSKGYINAVFKAQAPGGAALNFDTGNVYIGTSNTLARPYNGNIALFTIYNRALTPAEILQNYNATKGRFNL